jgi:hypothetical protein
MVFSVGVNQTQRRILTLKKAKGIAAMAASNSKLTPAALAVVGFATVASATKAHEWYSINGEPASPEEGGVMAARGLPLGDYWVRNDGDWGFAGNADVQGNIYGRRPSLSERGLLFSPSKWLG